MNQEEGLTREYFHQGALDFVLEYRRGRFNGSKTSEDLGGRLKITACSLIEIVLCKRRLIHNMYDFSPFRHICIQTCPI